MAQASASMGRFDAAERIVDVLEETVARSAGIPLSPVRAGASVLRALLRPVIYRAPSDQDFIGGTA
jgi:hypothetical protein